MKTNQFFLPFLLVFVFWGPVKSQDQKASDYSNNSKAEYLSDRPSTEWFEEAKFGMFIHWGLYSKLAGDWEGKRYYGICEWIMKRAQIPVNEYEKVASSFNPVKFNAEEWVLMAKKAGMKYIVITAKHHDGFAMFDSDVSNFNIIDATPFQRDPLKELAAACRKHGIKLGFYYSQTQDWHEPNAMGNNWDFDTVRDFNKYLEEKCKPQLEELLTKYGALSILWFDTPKDISKEESKKLVEWVHSYQPNCLTTSRVGNGMGDYLCLGDHQLPKQIINRPFEALFTHNDSWGYTKYDKNFRSPREIIRLLVETNAKGGNLLLNIGPKADGTFPKASVRMLKTVGAWINRNGEAIYGTTHTSFPDMSWGTTTEKPGKVFLHIFDYPPNAKLRVPCFTAKVSEVKLLASGKVLSHTMENGDLIVELPTLMPDYLNTVIEVAYQGELNPDTVMTLIERMPADLTTQNAILTGKTEKGDERWMEKHGDWKYAYVIEAWQNSGDKAEWKFNAVKPDWYYVYLDYNYLSENNPSEGLISIGDQKIYFQTVAATGKQPQHFFEDRIGIVRVEEGLNTLTIGPTGKGNHFITLRGVRLVPVR